MGNNPENIMTERWPQLEYEQWSATCETLHMFSQVVGKVRMECSYPENHWWHVALYVTPLGLTTGIMPYGERAFQIDFDFHSHRALIVVNTGECEEVSLKGKSVAMFYDEFSEAVKRLSIVIAIDTLPKEVQAPIRFELDTTHASYDSTAVERFHRVLLSADDLLREFQTGYCGKSSPVHFFWGSFDLNVTRFSGNVLPAASPGGCAISEEFSVGFWPGSARYPKAAFYAYAVPVPPKFYESKILPEAARFEPTLGEFILDYADIMKLDNPSIAIRQFLQTTYEAAATLSGWDRTTLEQLILEPIPE